MTLVLPNPHAVAPADVATLGSQVVAAAQMTEDVDEVIEMSHRWAAISEYVRRTTTEGLAQAEATKRRLEMRIGELCPAGPRGPLPSGVSSDTRGNSPLKPEPMAQARQMADAPEIVEQVIEDSTDADPPTKAKVIAAIKASMLSDIDRRAAEAVERWPELGDPDGGLDTPAKIADAGDTLAKDPWRIDNFRRHIAARKREREPGYVPPSLDPLVGLHCTSCGGTFTHECPGAIT